MYKFVRTFKSPSSTSSSSDKNKQETNENDNTDLTTINLSSESNNRTTKKNKNEEQEEKTSIKNDEPNKTIYYSSSKLNQLDNDRKSRSKLVVGGPMIKIMLNDSIQIDDQDDDYINRNLKG